MRKTTSILFLTLILLLSIASTVGAQSQNAAGAPPVGSCPPGFEPMTMMDMSGDMEHTHAGLKASLNSDEILCMRAATDTIHVHVDNVIP